MFSVGYLRRSRDASTDRLKFHSTSIRTICISRDENSNQLEFYHPPTRQLLYSDDFVLDKNLCSGPTFKLDYDGGLYINKYKDYTDENNILPYPPNHNMFVQSSDTPTVYTACKILRIPEKYGDKYTVVYDNGDIHMHGHWDLFDYNPNNSTFSNSNHDGTLPSWIMHNCNATLYLPTMEKPKHGTLLYTADKWYFKFGKGASASIKELMDFHFTARNMIKDFNLFQGHRRFKDIYHLRSTIQLKAAVAHHVSAHGLQTLVPPQSPCDHSSMSPSDKQIWDAAYLEEIQGLKERKTWETISENEFKKIQHKVKAVLPSMAISTIKLDENGKPKRAKYRVVALGNLDPVHWSKCDTYAPVMSMIELRFLTSLAVRNRRILKCGDIKQAFVQATLPPEELYIVRPPKGCLDTHPKDRWKLIRPLYGLRRAPKHWYDKFKVMLESLNLAACPNAPCLFHGHIIPDGPPIYVGIYVDDFVYFSTCPEVENNLNPNFPLSLMSTS